MYGAGRNSSFVIQDLIMQHFCVFQKVNIQNFGNTRNKINCSSDLVISYPPITQTQIKHMLPMIFKFRVNPYIETILSKTRENSKLKTRYLKGIMIEQLFIIFIARDYSQSSFIYLALKNQTRHTLFILFLFLRSHITIIQLR